MVIFFKRVAIRLAPNTRSARRRGGRRGVNGERARGTVPASTAALELNNQLIHRALSVVENILAAFGAYGVSARTNGLEGVRVGARRRKDGDQEDPAR